MRTRRPASAQRRGRRGSAHISPKSNNIYDIYARTGRQPGATCRRATGKRGFSGYRARRNGVHVDPYIVLGSAVVGLLVGMTGAGGGALMTPMLILIFGVTPSTAISSDLVAAVMMRPLGAFVHLRRKTVHLGLVRWMVVGSVP